jgi:Holliday junction DNA helicase RuvA
MYSYFKGILTEKSPDTVVIECGGVGYELKIPLSSFDLLPSLNELVKLYVYAHTKEDGTRLFGFYKQQEKELFKLLINISGIGPKTALAIMSSISIKELITAVISQNYNIITKAPGMGKKTAERLVVELKHKIEDITDIDSGTGEIEQVDITKDEAVQSGYNNDIWHEVESALTSLGFKSYEIKKALQSIKIKDKTDTSAIVKESIKFIYLKRNEG